MVDAIKGALASPLLLVSLRSRHASLSGELSLVVLVAGVVFQETSSSILDIREGVNGKKKVFFRALPELPKPPPMTPIWATWSSFFRRSKFKI